ncbi:MAG: diguanylate cyclase, partial [Holophagales bacterium]|nr:diguanylate cyclase [Holophagales bacterium]
ELDPAALLEKVGDRLTQFERQRSEQQGTIERLSHSLAVQQVDDTFDDAQSRRNVLHRLDDALAYARTRSAPLACLLAAIDRPEELRAEHGSTAYDFVLVQVAQRLKLSLRHRDVLLRYDNRSFVLITDAESCAAAYNHGTRLVAEVEARPVELGPGRIPVSISIAITFRHPSTHRARDLLRRAQQVLDKASAWGSAQVAIDPRSVRHEKGEE